MLFVGIDPGKHGAIAWLDGERKQIAVHDCPLAGGDFDRRTILDMLRFRAPAWTSVTMEEVHAMPGDGKCSAFSFGRAFELWVMALAAVGIQPRLVAPRTWKRTMLAGVANDEQAEAKALKQRFQGHPICSQLHGPRGGLRDGRVDALWLAEYGRMAWKLSGGRS